MKMLKGRSDSSSINHFQTKSKLLTEIYSQQEVLWRKRSKQLWLRESEQNSRFFHASAKNRRKANHIETLKDKDGQTVGWET